MPSDDADEIGPAAEEEDVIEEEEEEEEEGSAAAPRADRGGILPSVRAPESRGTGP